MISELNAIIISILSLSVGGTLIGTLLYWRYNKRLKELEVEKAKIETNNEEWHLYKEQLDFANERIVSLLKINADKEQRLMDKEEYYNKRVGEIEERFNKQTEYLRGIQRSYKDGLEEINRLTEKVGMM